MDKMNHWKVRDGNEKDMEEIFSLRRNAFGEVEKDKLDSRFWRWQFLEGPAGKAFIYIAEDKDKVVGHFADLPRRFSIHGKVVRGTFSVDIMVHSGYRRRGIFQTMGRYAIRCVKNESGPFMLACLIRRETIQGFRKIGWEEVVDLPVLVYPIKFRGIVNRYLHFLPLSFLMGGAARLFYNFFFQPRKRDGSEEILIEEIRELDDRFESFCHEALSLYPIMGIRDRDYMTWRYFRHPTRTYTIYRAMERGEMRGFIVLRKVDLLEFNSAVIVDLLAFDESVLIALVRKGILHSQREGADLLGFMVPKLHPYYKVLRHCGFLPSLKAFLLMIYSHEEGRGLFDAKAWYVNWGDTDVI
jgi:GNAT superfamily N-acetyltransferase